MQELLNFIIDKYIMFDIISAVLIFALIGYFVDMRRRKKDPYHVDKKEDINLENIGASGNVALNDALNQNAGVNMAIDQASSTVNMASNASNNQQNF